jgi:hypothetical protein
VAAVEGTMTRPRISRCVRFRFCDTRLNAWLPAPRVPDGAMPFRQLSQQHLTEVGSHFE